MVRRNLIQRLRINSAEAANRVPPLGRRKALETVAAAWRGATVGSFCNID